MLRQFFETMMGGSGMALLNFYLANSLWINLLVLAYGIFLVLCWSNLKTIRKLLILSMVSQLRSRPDVAIELPTKKELKSLSIPWESAIGEARFPFVARQNDFLPHRVSPDAVKSMIPIEHLNKEALKAFQKQQKRAANK